MEYDDEYVEEDYPTGEVQDEASADESDGAGAERGSLATHAAGGGTYGEEDVGGDGEDGGERVEGGGEGGDGEGDRASGLDALLSLMDAA